MVAEEDSGIGKEPEGLKRAEEADRATWKEEIQLSEVQCGAWACRSGRGNHKRRGRHWPRLRALRPKLLNASRARPRPHRRRAATRAHLRCKRRGKRRSEQPFAVISATCAAICRVWHRLKPNALLVLLRSRMHGAG
eukprot:scaffold328087_cov52-Tisochrysis_lutea.AAC.4